ncbi:helix-hairpin-helix domain-containing protein [Candidatus Binatia bacterium]|nr:helix-hairpin-helix domain-containing protein [Candidatus Binatia bacterium]
MTRSKTIVAIVGAMLLAAVATAPVSVAMAEERLVDINSASVGQLAELKGIGPAKAEAIVAFRDKSGPFKSVDDLQQVSGIGEKLLATLRPQITVGPAAAALAPGAPAAAGKK